MTKTLLMVGIGMTGMAFLDSAARLGVAVHGIELPERKFGYVDLISAFTDCRGLVDELWVEAAESAVRDARPDGVLAFNEAHVTAAALVQDLLGLPGPSLRAATVSRNKALQRAVFAAAQIPQPDYLVVEDVRDAREWAVEHLPVFVKPLSLTGGAGVEHVAREGAVEEVVRRRSGTGKLLVEAEVVGPEYHWDAVVVGGEARIASVSETETSGPPHFIELAHRIPAQLSTEERRKIDMVASRVLAAMRMRTGIVHLECRMTADGPVVIEVAVRMPGDGMMELLELTYGVSWFDLLVMAALGDHLPELPAAPVRHAASYLPPLTGGVVTGVTGFDEVREHPLVVDVRLAVSPGDLVPTSTSSMELAGQIAMVAPTRAELEDVLAYLRRSLRILTSSAEPVYEAKVTSAGASIYPLF